MTDTRATTGMKATRTIMTMVHMWDTIHHERGQMPGR